MRGKHIRFKISPFKLFVCLLCLVLGGMFIVLMANTPPLPEDQQQFQALYCSYREEKGFGLRRNRKVYISVELSDYTIKEYYISSVLLLDFADQEFLKEVSVGESINLVVSQNSILSLGTDEKEYLTLEDAYSDLTQNRRTGFLVGGIFILLSLICFCSQFYITRYK